MVVGEFVVVVVVGGCVVGVVVWVGRGPKSVSEPLVATTE